MAMLRIATLFAWALVVPVAMGAPIPVSVSGGVGVYAAGNLPLSAMGSVSKTTSLGSATATAGTVPLPSAAASAISTLPQSGWGNSSETSAGASLGYSVVVLGPANTDVTVLVTASGSVGRGGTGAGGGPVYGAAYARFSINSIGLFTQLLLREACVGYASSPVQPSSATCSLSAADGFSVVKVPIKVKANTELRVGLSTLATATDAGTATATVDPYFEISPDTPNASQYSLQFSEGISQAQTPNYQGLWYASPAESESGWGINFAHQGDVIFATWFTYDLTGKAWWLSMTANKAADGTYTGTLYETHGPPFSAVPFSPAAVTSAPAGTGKLTFADTGNGTFAYTVNGVSQTKPITRQVFGAMPTCVFGGQPNLALATNYQDLWYASPAESEAGWGVNLTHQGDTIFATWFTYDLDGTPMWLSATAPRTAPSVYTGTLYRTRGPPFNAVPFNPGNVTRTVAGTLTLTFANGNAATFAYTLDGVSQSKSIVRQVFRTPGTVCN